MNELTAAYGKLLASQTKEELPQTLEMILPANNLDELTGIFMGAKSGMPPEVFKLASYPDQKKLYSNGWSALKTRVGIK